MCRVAVTRHCVGAKVSQANAALLCVRIQSVLTREREKYLKAICLFDVAGNVRSAPILPLENVNQTKRLAKTIALTSKRPATSDDRSQHRIDDMDDNSKQQQQPLIFSHIEQAENFTVFDTKWVPGTSKFVAVGGKANAMGIIKVYELNNGRLNTVREFNKKSTLKTGTFLSTSPRHQSHFVIGDFEGSLQILNIERLDGFVFKNDRAHQGIINGIDSIGGSSSSGALEIVSGGQDGCVKVWDPRQKDSPVACFVPLEESEGGVGRQDCWTVAFGNTFNTSERCVCAGYDNGDIKMFDLRAMAVRWEANVRQGICHIEFDDKRSELNRLAVGTLNGGIFAFDFSEHRTNGEAVCIRNSSSKVTTMRPTNGRSNTKVATVWCVKHLPQNKKLLTTCDGNGKVQLWDSSRKSGETDLQLVQEYQLSKHPINSLDWSPDRAGLAVCGSFEKTIQVLISVDLPRL